MKIRYVAGFGPIARDVEEGMAFYADLLGLPLPREGYPHTEVVDGVKHFALWPLAQAARSCLGTDEWPAAYPVPQGWIEFDVDDVAAATAGLRQRGFQVLLAEKREPWDQTVTRLLGAEGLLAGITFTPHLR